MHAGRPNMSSPELPWFRRPTAQRLGTLNLCYAVLDRAILTGDAQQPLIEGQVAAELIETVSALASAFRGYGAGPGELVLLGELDDRSAVLSTLAAARIGATVVTTPAEHLAAVRRGVEPVVEVAQGTVNGVADALILQAGRTDPAGVAELPADAAFALRWGPERSVLRTVEEAVRAISEQEPPYTYAELRVLGEPH